MKKKITNEAYNEAYNNVDNRRIINSVLSHYKGQLDTDTLKNCGLVGLWRALENHDSSYKTKFTSSLWRFTKYACRTELQALARKQQKKNKNEFEHSNIDNIYLDNVYSREEPSLNIFNEIDDILSKEQAKIVRMRFVENMTLEEIGSQMGYTKETARQKLKLALNKISEVVYNDSEDRTNISIGA